MNDLIFVQQPGSSRTPEVLVSIDPAPGGVALGRLSYFVASRLR
jgi:hypothetical protein